MLLHLFVHTLFKIYIWILRNHYEIKTNFFNKRINDLEATKSTGRILANILMSLKIVKEKNLAFCPQRKIEAINVLKHHNNAKFLGEKVGCKLTWKSTESPEKGLNSDFRLNRLRYQFY